MVATRERPDITIKVWQEFDSDGIPHHRNEIALRHFKFISLQFACSRQQLISRASRQNKKVRSFPITVNAIAWLVPIRLHRNDVRLPHGASRFACAVEQ